jgi:hypothetical protein
MILRDKVTGVVLAAACAAAVMSVLDTKIREDFIAACDARHAHVYGDAYYIMHGLASGMVMLAVFYFYIYVRGRLRKKNQS